jgi:hypothetical protein
MPPRLITSKDKRENNNLIVASQNRSKDEFDFDNHLTQPQNCRNNENIGTSKDFGLLIFHALGKFLYNKRIDIRTQEAVYMTADQLQSIPKPKFYWNHQEILNKVDTESHTLSLFLEENMYDFFKDIEDMAKVLDVYSGNDKLTNFKDIYSHANEKYFWELKEQWALSEALAITEFNIHGYEIKDPKDKKKGKLHTMAKPEWFDFKKKADETKQWIYETTKFEQNSGDRIISEQLLLGTTRVIWKDYIPYLNSMGYIRKHPSFERLSKLSEFSKSIPNVFKNSNRVEESEICNEERDKEFEEKIANTKAQNKLKKIKHQFKDGKAWNVIEETKFQQEEIEDSSDEVNDSDLEDVLKELEQENLLDDLDEGE